MTIVTDEKCVICNDLIEFDKTYVLEEVTFLKNDVGKSTECHYHRLCYLRSRR